MHEASEESYEPSSTSSPGLRIRLRLTKFGQRAVQRVQFPVVRSGAAFCCMGTVCVLDSFGVLPNPTRLRKFGYSMGDGISANAVGQ